MRLAIELEMVLHITAANERGGQSEAPDPDLSPLQRLATAAFGACSNDLQKARWVESPGLLISGTDSRGATANSKMLGIR